MSYTRTYKSMITILVLLFTGFHAEAQLLEKLKKRAQEKGLETREVSYDSAENAKNRLYSEGEELEINTARDFFTTDVEMKMYYETDEVIRTQFFDAEAIAMRTEGVAGQIKPMFHDSEGYFYAFNPDVGGYEKNKLLSSGMMGFMTAGMIPKFYKLPAEPYLDAFKALEEKEITLNFLILELAFIYKKDHFEDDEYYIAENVTCNGSNNCLRFKYNDPEYPGSYIQFDDKGRLAELYVNTINPMPEEEHPTGRFIYTYNPVSVNLPDAVEIKSNPFGDMIDLNKGLEPWRHNKKDNKKKKGN
ncbi:MAG: hypothetical protein KJO00_06215 [Bacteroidia bacterium]|nr:hypothetical protein [Bacteroidia bacterium]